MTKALLGKAFGELLVGPAGFEPTHTEPKSVVLPLDDGPNFPLKGSANIISYSFYANLKSGNR